MVPAAWLILITFSKEGFYALSVARLQVICLYTENKGIDSRHGTNEKKPVAISKKSLQSVHS